MRIKKFYEFINEELKTDPVNYIGLLLKELKHKIDSYFDDNSKPGEVLNYSTLNNKEEKEMSFQELNLHLNSSEISTINKIEDSLTIKFDDGEAEYSLLIAVPLKSNTEAIDVDDIRSCQIKLKKYNFETTDYIGEIEEPVDGDDSILKLIDEDYIINLIVKLNDRFSDDQEDFKIETE